MGAQSFRSGRWNSGRRKDRAHEHYGQIRLPRPQPINRGRQERSGNRRARPGGIPASHLTGHGAPRLPRARASYLFLPRIQKGRSPGPALARSWASSSLSCVTSAWSAFTIAASALSWSTSRRSPAISPGNPAMVPFKEAASPAAALSPATSVAQRLETGFQFLQALLHLGGHLRRRLPPAGAHHRREIRHYGIQRVFLD